jgi:hypothetical protein
MNNIEARFVHGVHCSSQILLGKFPYYDHNYKL